MRFSIRHKIIAFAFCVAVFVGGSIALYSAYTERRQIIGSFERDAQETTALIARTIADDLYLLDVASVRRRLESSRANSVIRYVIVSDADGSVLTDGTTENARRGQKLADNFSARMLRSNSWVSQADGEIFKVGGPIFMPDGSRAGYLLTGFSFAQADQLVRTATRSNLYIAILSIGIGAIVAFVFSAGFNRAILSIVQAAKAIGEGKLDTRLEIARSDELGTLAGSINQMAEALNESYHNMELKVAERTADLDALYTALTPFASSNGNELIQNVVERLKEATHADAALIRVFDIERQSFLYPAHIGFPSSYLDATRQVDPGSAIGTSFRTGEPIISADIREDPRLKGKKQLEEGFASCAFLPLRVSGQLRGILHVASRMAGHFNEQKRDHLMAIARHMGMAMENHELFEESRRGAEEQAALRAIAMAASQSLDLHEMLQNALAKTLQATERSIGIVHLRDDVTGRLRVVAHQGISQGYAKALDAEQRIDPKTIEVLSTGKINVMDDPTPAELMEDSRDEGIRSRVRVPIRAHGRISGVLAVASKVVRRFSAREVELLKAIGSIFGTAVANAGLFEETKQRAKEQEALNVIAKAISQSLHRDELLEIALKKILEVTGRERVSIRLKNRITGEVRLVAHQGFSPEEVQELVRRVPHEASDRVFTSGEPLVVNNRPEIHDAQSLLPQSHAVAWIPIKVGAKVLGVLGVAAGRPIPFMQREVDVLQAVGNVIGIALENAGLFEKTQRDLQRIQALREIDQAITSRMDLRDRLNILLEKIELFFPYPSATAIRLVSNNTGEVEFLACRQTDEGAWSRRALTFPGHRVKQAIETKTPVTVRNVAATARSPEFYQKQGLVSYIALPLIVKNEAIGVLSLYTKEEHDFTQEEIESLETLVGQAAVAIHEAKLYEETERRRREAEELARLARSLTETLDMTAVGERIVTSVQDLFNAKHATLRLLQADGSLRAIASTGEGFSKTTRSDAVSPGSGVTSRAIAEGKPFWSPDMLKDPEIHLTDRMRDYQRRTGNSAMLAVPLRAHEKIIGALALSHQTGRGYSDREVALAQTFADQAALALENARLFDEVKQKIEELQQKTMELEKANKAKDEFLSTMSHELRTPLNVVIGYAAMLKDGMLGKLNREQEEALGKVLGRADDQLQMINTILQATQIGAGAVVVNKEAVNLNELLEEVRSSYDLPTGKEIRIEWDYSRDLPLMQSDSDKIKHILQNLIGNAIKFTERGRITISVRYISGLELVEFQVTDTGVGIPKGMLPVIFEMFRQVDSSERREFEGVGLGLYIVKQLTELLGGRIEVESEEGRGSTFTVTIPAELQVGEGIASQTRPLEAILTETLESES